MGVRTKIATLLATATLLTSCAGLSDGYQIVQLEIGGRIFSCRGNWCCYPYSHDAGAEMTCVEAHMQELQGDDALIVWYRRKLP
jgi:hypothetical protein